MWSELVDRGPESSSRRTRRPPDPRRASPPTLALLLALVGLLALAAAPEPAAAQDAGAVDGFRVVTSPRDVPATLERVKVEVEGRGLSVFSEVDHAANAASVGQELPPTRLLLFGNPTPGTRLMQCGRTVAVDLPMKMLVWEGEDGRTRIGWNEPTWLAGRHGIDAAAPECGPVLAGMTDALASIARAAAADRR
jgi:uncharacterized protein (DUF302 family)